MRHLFSSLKDPRAAGVWLLFAGFSLITLWLAGHVVESDVAEYHRYALQALSPPLGQHWPREYPALSLSVFLLPLLLPCPYRISFAVLTLAALAGLIQYGMTRHGTRWALTLLGYLTLGTIGLFGQRYDIFPALAAFIALDQARQQHWTPAWAWSVLGFALKLWPAVLWPVFIVQQWRTQGRVPWKQGGFSILAAGLLLVIPALWAPDHAFTACRYLIHRPVEFESTAASLTLLFGHPHFFYAFGSVNVRDQGMAHAWSAILTALGAGLGLGVLWLQKQGRVDLTTAALYAMGLMLLTSKVFSAQYLIWLAPLLALKKGNGALVLAFLATSLGYPLAYALWPIPSPVSLIVFAVRNGLLILGGGLFVRRTLRGKRNRQVNRRPYTVNGLR